VPAQDVAALEAAIEKTLFDSAFTTEVRGNVARVRENFYWERTLAPLVEFVRTASHASDYTGKRADLVAGLGKRRKQHGVAHDARMAWHHLVNAGPGAVLSRIRGRIQGRTSRPH
jgi:hypothetical protein